MKFFEHGQKRLLSLVLSLVLLVSLVPVISLPAYAENIENKSIDPSTAQFYDDGSLKEVTISFDVQEAETTGLAAALGKFVVHSGPANSSVNWYNPCKDESTSFTDVHWPVIKSADSSVVASANDSFRWTASTGAKSPIAKFDQGAVQPGTYYLYMWSLVDNAFSSGAYPDTFFAKIKIEDGKLQVVYSQDEDFPAVHTHQWVIDFIEGNGTKEASTAIFCADPDCDAPMQVDVTLTASDVTLPGNVFSAEISVEKIERPAVAFALRPAPQAPAGLPEGLPAGLTISEPVYKYSATGSGYEPIDPTGFTPKAGYYQAAVQITDGNNNNSTVAELAVKYTVSDPAVTAATGDNRPIELMIMGMAFFCAMAAAAFVLDGRRKAR